MSLITLQNTELTVVISTMGAELQSIRDKNGNEMLWDGNPQYWASHAPIMFPVCGGLKDDVYYLDGERYEMPKHGFAKRVEWTAETVEAEKAVFLTTEKHPGFPFDYELRAVYELQDCGIRISYEVKNTGSKTFWYSVGSHEAYAFPGVLEDCTIVFDQPETLTRYTLDGNLLNKVPEIMGENVTEFPMKTEYFAVDALVFPTLKSRGVTMVNSAAAHKVRVDYEGMDTLMLWTKPGAGYLCIEPWCNHPDFVDSDQQIEHKPGMIRLAPGEGKTKTHTVRFL